MGRASRRRKRPKGAVEELPSGALRVKVYAGLDPLTKKRHYLRETVPAGPRAEAAAEKALRRLLHQVDEQRNPRTNATLDQLLDRHLDLLDLEETTQRTYRGYVEHHIRPLVGKVRVGAFDADLMDSFYAELRRCRAHCDGRSYIEHRTDRTHDCDDRCGRHACRPLSASTIRQIHFILSGAFKRAVRWRWVAINPMTQAEPPAAPTANPQPPSAKEAAVILNEAWRDPDWGAFVWVAMTTGARRGELCALRWHDVDLENGAVRVARSVAQVNTKRWLKDTKTHQQRRIALDPETVTVLSEHRMRCDERATAVGLDLTRDAYVFSLEPDNSTHLLPDSVSQRFRKLALRLGIKTHLHNLRHYSATELIAAGVDVRTVAGRLGHSGGGTTTLRVYTAWVSESDQRASRTLFSRMPTRPQTPDESVRAMTNPRSPYQRVAAAYRERIVSGELRVGDQLPAIKEIARREQVAFGTAQRAVTLLASWGFVSSSPGKRAIVLSIP